VNNQHLFKIISASIVFLQLTLPGSVWSAAPKGPPPPGGWSFDKGITAGIGTAYMHDQTTSHNFVPSFDATFFKRIKRHLSFWSSLGIRVPVSRNSAVVIPYFETGFNMIIFNLGAGYGPVINNTVAQQINIFTGIAVPLKPMQKNRVIFAHIYYRPGFNFGNGEFWMSHEVGILFKWLLIFKTEQSNTKQE
jgi:hypothetical protein